MTRALLVLLCVLGPAPAMAQRLAETVRPEHYRLWFAPDLTSATFKGRTTIDVQLREPTSAITLHAVEITLDEASITSGGRTQTARVSTNDTAQTATLSVPAQIAGGPATIEIRYRGVLNDRLRGFYLSRANGRRYAITQLEATDARRAFPSFDEPAFKARFDISLQINGGDTAISNGALVSDRPGPDPGTHTLTFATTKPISTYLVAMVVGDFVCRAGASDGTPIRVCSTPDKRELTAFALQAAQQQVKFYNDYFGIKYPFGKLDLVAVPDFAAGAMENAGAVLFRERLLLLNATTAAPASQKSVAGIIAHELANQWFGNLVTMKWWDDIWLNEGFATWMASKPLAAWRSDWRIELDDAASTQDALATDALQSTRPIRARAETPAEIDALFDGIAYEKTAAVLRMVESYVGAERFRDGIRSYLRTYSYANAAGEDLWNELTGVTGRPVDAIFKSFVDQPGAPLVSLANRCQGPSGELRLTQERFVASSSPLPQSGQWTLPVCFSTGGRAPRCELVRDPAQALANAPCSAFANAGSRGYYLTEYPPDVVNALGRQPSRLTPAERIGLLGDEWWMVRAGRHDVGTYLSLVEGLATDSMPAVVETMSAPLAFVGSELAQPSNRAQFEGWIRARFGPPFTALDGSNLSAMSEARQTMYAIVLQLLGVNGSDPAAQRRAADMASAYLSGASSPPPAITQSVLQVAAFAGDTTRYTEYADKLATLTGQPEEYYRVLNALSWFRDPQLTERTLQMTLSPQVRTQDIGAIISGVIARPWSRDAGWEFVTREWKGLLQRLGTFQGVPAIVSSLGNFCSEEKASEVREFFTANPLPTAPRGLQQAIERIETCAAMRKRQTPAMARWLAGEQ